MDSLLNFTFSEQSFGIKTIKKGKVYILIFKNEK